VNNLDGDLTVEAGIEGNINRGHAAVGDEATDLVAATQGLASQVAHA
jgi:hypothetical protein